MNTLIKDGEVIKVDPQDTLTLYKYAKYYMRWESEEFIKKLWELRSYKEKLDPYKYIDYYDEVRFIDKNSIEKGIAFYIPLNFVLLPTYMHMKVPESCESIIKPKRNDVVDIDELSLFNVYKVVDGLKDIFRLVKLGISIEYRQDINSYGIRALRVVAVDKNVRKIPQEDLYIISVFHDIFREEDTLTEYLEKIKKLQGTKYSEIEGINDDIEWIEKSLITTLNLINALHTNEFDENDIVGWLLKPHSDAVKSFGGNFEDAISVIKEVSALLL
jgi:hypothetical protein